LGFHKTNLSPRSSLYPDQNYSQKKVILCANSDGGIGCMDAGDVVGFLSVIQNRREEFPHVWSWK
jgi:hypothetical protein